MKRYYICHTYYHVYVSMLKEMNRDKADKSRAIMVLSKMSTDFEQLRDRLLTLDFFEDVIEFDERREDNFPELAKYRAASPNLVISMIKRIIFTKKYARYEAPFVPVEFQKDDEIYVFCDADPIGYYLNWKKIPYHSVECALDTLACCDDARYDNRTHFGLKAFLSSKLNLIHIQNGYSKYCVDMEVNDLSVLKYVGPNYKEVNRLAMVNALTDEQKALFLRAFVKDLDKFLEKVKAGADREKKIVILTEPLCDLSTRERIFKDIIAEYGADAQVYIKPHPRDLLDYDALFSDYIVIDRSVPMEMMNFIPGVSFDTVISVFTSIEEIQFARNKILLGPDFMDKYEAPNIHRQNEQI